MSALSQLFRARGWSDPTDLIGRLASSTDDSHSAVRQAIDRTFLGANSTRADDAVVAITAALRDAPGAAAPARTLGAVLFLDVVDSTRHAAEIGDVQWAALIERFYEAARSIVGKMGGRIVKTTGDGILAVMPDASSAIDVARRLQDLAARNKLSTRSGIHLTEMTSVDEVDIGGLGVNIAARVMGLAPDGRIAVTAAVRDVLSGSAGRFVSIGLHTLKGVPGDWEILLVSE